MIRNGQLRIFAPFVTGLARMCCLITGGFVTGELPAHRAIFQRDNTIGNVRNFG